jgi:hypothetical protein
MVKKYLFKLKKSYEPDLTQKDNKKNEQYGGIRLTYNIYIIYHITLFGQEIPCFRWKLGKKTFLRPYKKFWDKRTYRLPNVYWGKRTHPLTRLWVIIPNNFPLGNNRIVPEASLIHQYVKLFGRNFRSKDITTRLYTYKVKKFVLSTIKN